MFYFPLLLYICICYKKIRESDRSVLVIELYCIHISVMMVRRRYDGARRAGHFRGKMSSDRQFPFLALLPANMAQETNS